MRVKEEFLQICQENYKLFNNCSGDIDTQDYSKKKQPISDKKAPSQDVLSRKSFSPVAGTCETTKEQNQTEIRKSTVDGRNPAPVDR